MDQLKDGVYLLRWTAVGVEYLRRVAVSQAFNPPGGLPGGYYRFVDENGTPISQSMSIAIALTSGSKFEPADKPVEFLLAENDEVIHWHNADEITPDDGTNVLIKAPYSSVPTWVAYLEDNTWHYADGSKVGEDVTFWADLPLGPIDDEDKTHGVTADLPPRQPLLSNAVAKATSGIGFGEGLSYG